MSPVTHFIGSWLVASVVTNNSRDRKLVTLAGIIPDLNGLGIVADVGVGSVSGKEVTFHYYQQFYHLLLHGWPAALTTATLLAGFARNRARVFIFGLLTFHLHLLCDLIGSRGPAPGDLWPICYSEPPFRHSIWFWKNQWRLDGWQNQLVFVVVFAGSIWVALRKGFSFVEIFHAGAEQIVIGVLVQWRGGIFRS